MTSFTALLCDRIALYYPVFVLQGVDREQHSKPIINSPYKPEVVCPSARPPSTRPPSTRPTTSKNVAIDNRGATSYLLLLSTYIYLAAFAEL